MWKQIDLQEQILERLPFETNGTYSGVEAAIHIARYALARNLCQGKKVLDIACGEGYGARLLLEWGAAEVVGVDISEDAIASARKNFSKPGIRYLCGDAQDIDQVFTDEKFDLIVSFETIEHLQRPDEYISAIARLRSQNACVLITCPNDWWYYPKEHEGNVYHVRKYTCDEFIGLVAAGLGAPDAVGVGAPGFGFANFPLSRVRSYAEKMSQIEMMNCVDHGGLLALPPEPGSVSVRNSSYFVAGWGVAQERLAGAAMFPISMDLFSTGFWQGSLAAQNGGADKDEQQLKLRLAESKLESALKEIARLSNLPDASVEDKKAMESLSERLEVQCLLTQKYRNQANALFRETALLQQALAEKDRIISEQEIYLKTLLAEKDRIISEQEIYLKTLLAEKDRIISEQEIYLKTLLAEKDRIISEQEIYLKTLLAEKDRIISEQEIYLRALLKRWNFVTAIPRKILPPRLVAGVKNLVRNLRGSA